MSKVYAFDIDETLDCAGGPVSIDRLIQLRSEGHIVGLCGNVHAFCSKVDKWWEIISFTLNYDGGPWGCLPKDKQLTIFKTLTYKKADEYIMVGNIAGVSGSSDDQGAAQRAGWRFIRASDFAKGVR